MRGVKARELQQRALPVRVPGPPAPVGRWRLLLVLGVLAGLFGMHALSMGGVVAGAAAHGSGHGPGTAMTASRDVPGTAMTAAGHVPGTAMTAAGSATSAVVVDESVCHGDMGGDGHAHHADATCASGAVGGGAALPVPLPDPVAATVLTAAGHRFVAATPEGGRAPPSLAELQLLRI